MTSQHDVNNYELDELNPDQAETKPMFANNMDLVRNVKVQLTIKLGDAELTVDELFTLEKGSIVKMIKETNQPLDIELEGKLIARGALVAVDDNFGIKITEIGQS